MIARAAESTVLRLAEGFPVVAITGPRQSDKTSLARRCFPAKHAVVLVPPPHSAVHGDPGRLPDFVAAH